MYIYIYIYIYITYVCVLHIMEVTANNLATGGTVHISDISLNKYDCHTANITHTATCYIGIYILHFCTYMQNITTFNIYFTGYYSICTRNKYAFKIEHICYIWQLLDEHQLQLYIHICGKYKITCINHEKWAVYTYLIYITE